MMDEDLNQENITIKKKKEAPPDKLECIALLESINNYFIQSGIYILDTPNNNCKSNFINMIRMFMYKY